MLTLDQVYTKYYDLVKKVVEKEIEADFYRKYNLTKSELIYIVLGIIYQESKGNEKAIGDDGCSYGLMQLNWCAGTPQYFGAKSKEELLIAENNITYGVRFIKYLFEKLKNKAKVISAYNIGEKKVGLNPGYVKSVAEYVLYFIKKELTTIATITGLAILFF